MNLIWHQFRKDVRQFGIILAVWAVMLGLNLAADLGWVGAANFGQGQDVGSVVNFLTWLQDMCLWGLYLLIPTAVVLTDSPANREGFLRTRPLAAGDLWLAKGIFVVALIVAPMLLEAGAYLALAGLLPGQVLHGVVDRVLYALPLVVIAAAFASLWRGYAQWAGALALAFGGSLLAVGLVELAGYLVNHTDLLQPAFSASETSRSLAAYFGFAIAALVLAGFHARGVWSPLKRWLGIATTIMVFLAVYSYWPWDLVKLAPADPVAAEMVVQESSPGRQVELNPMFDKNRKDQWYFNVAIKRELNRAAFPSLVEWDCRSVEIVTAAGEKVPPVQVARPADDRRGYGSPPATDLKIWAGLLPKNAFFLLDQPVYPYEYPDASLGDFALGRHEDWLGTPATLRAGLAGKVYQWNQVADFAMDAPATKKDAHGQWTFLKLDKGDPRGVPYLLVKRSQVAFSTATDARDTGFAEDPRDRFDFVIYDPVQATARLTGSYYMGGFTSRGADTALVQYWMKLGIGDGFSQNWKASSPAELAQCHLLIFEKTWLGTVPKKWESGGLVIKDQLAPVASAAAAGFQGISHSEVERRVAELPLPGADASREEVCRYLVQVVPIMDASRYSAAIGEPVIARLASLVPAHLDVLLQGLAAMNSPSQGAVVQAIIQGAEESEKDQVIVAVPANPELMEILIQRGWLVPGHAAIQKLVEGGAPLTFEAIQAIASFQDPTTYPRLLAAFEASPRNDVYDILRTLPGMAGPLAASVDKLWRTQDRLMANDLGNFRAVLDVALHTGKPEALRLAYRLLAETNPKSPTDNWALAQVFQHNVRLDGADNRQNVLKWMQRHGPDAFAFDPVRQQFVLKAGQT